jgi:hypothetical protein
MRLPSLALVLPLLASLALGCGASAVRIQATAIEASALVLHTTGDIVTEASYRDARSTCPDGSPVACLDPVSTRWEPVDLALDGARAALGAWYAADLVAHRLGGAEYLRAALEGAQRFARTYVEIVALARRLGADLPALPEIVTMWLDSMSQPVAP